MRTLRRLAHIGVWTLLACASPGAPPAAAGGGRPAPDLSRLRVTSAVPAPAARSYGATVEWLSEHTRRHAQGAMDIGDKHITARSELAATQYDCVLLHTLTLEAASTGRRTTIGQVIALAELARSTIEVSSQTGRSGCVNFEGETGAVVEIQLDPVREAGRSREGMICFDSREAAGEAAQALVHLATLCGAR